MSKRIIEALKVYLELNTDDPESELTHVKVDLDRALEHAPLTGEEREIITYLYLTEPVDRPIRKLDKNGGQTGRPPGGTTQASVSKLIAQDKSVAARENKTSRVIRKAADKLATFLGDDYQ